MKKTLLIGVLILSMLTMVGFAPVGTSYWEDMKEIYEWNGIKSESEMEITLVTPDMNKEYKVHMVSESNLKDFSTYSEIHIEDVKDGNHIPTIKMYTSGSNMYLNKDAVVYLLSLMELEETVAIEEEYVMLQGSQEAIELDANILNDAIKLIEDMDLNIDLGMVKDGDTYTLTLDSDKLIDLLDEYMIYIFTNIDQLPNSFTQQEIVITEEEKQEVLEQYNAFVTLYKDMAKEFIAGSKYHQESTFGDGEYSEKAEVLINTPMGQLEIKTVSTSAKLDSSNIQLPESVMVITEDDLNNMIMSQFMPEVDGNVGLKAVIGLDGSYMKLGEDNLEEGTISLKVEEGKSYITAEDAYEVLGVEVENADGYFYIRELNNYGFYVDWNEDAKSIEIY